MKVLAVVVAFNPELLLFRAVVEAAMQQASRILIFDNGAHSADLDAYYQTLNGKAAVHRPPSNEGIGSAINFALWLAESEGFSHLLVLDQDSVIEPDMVATLVGVIQKVSQGSRVAAVGPQFYDARSSKVAPFVRVAFPMSKKLYGGPGQLVECDFLISSGSLLSLDAVAVVGGMDEGLFIDNVDLEWSFRARHRGYKLLGVCDARMAHQIGEHIDIPLIGRQTVHSPTRLYYIMRNRVLLYSRRETPRAWIAQDIPRVILKFLKMSLFVRPRRTYVKAMLRGLGDGIRGRSGRIGD